MDYLYQLLDQREERERGDDPPHIIEPEDLLGLTDYGCEGTDRSLLASAAACCVEVDFIEADTVDTERATAGDTPLLRIAITDDITQRTNTIKE